MAQMSGGAEDWQPIESRFTLLCGRIAMIPCSIIGQSNSILGTGFAAKLFGSNQVKLAKSGRLGGSPSLIAPYFAKGDFMSDAPFCLIDTCIIDYSCVGGQFISYADIVDAMEWVGHKARMNGSCPIFLILPVEFFIFRDEPFLRLYRDILERSSHYFLDFRDVAMARFPMDIKDKTGLYRDGAHPGEKLSEAVAEVLAKFMTDFSRFPQRAMDIEAIVPNYDVINVQQTLRSDNKRIDHCNSMIEFHGIEIDDAHPAIIEAGNCSRVNGFVANAARSTSDLSLGDGTFVKSMKLLPYSNAQLEARLVPLRARHVSCGDKLRLAISDGSVRPESTFRSQPEVPGPAITQISDVIVERGRDHLKYRARIPSPESTNIMDLVRTL